MRRAMLAALSVIALALASPGAALAHHHGHRGHHKGKVKAHHARVHFEHFGAPAPTSSDANAGSGGEGSSGEETKAASPSEVVGTVTSFENEVLTITLNDGSTVKGKVTSSTRIECMSTMSTTQSSDEESSGDGKSSVEDQGSGDDEGHEGDQRSSDEEQSKDQGDDNEAETAAAEPACGTSALTPGTGVREAELKIGPAGTEFESIELVK